jgi:hypothetical protein
VTAAMVDGCRQRDDGGRWGGGGGGRSIHKDRKEVHDSGMYVNVGR